MKNFLLVGNGAREHAIAEAICRDNEVRLYAYMNAKNPGIIRLCQKSGGEFKIGDIEDGEEIARWAKQKNITLAFASPDAVLAAGVSDALIGAGIKTASPTKAASRIEWDKAYLRELAQSRGIDANPKWKIFENLRGLGKYIDELGEVAIKPVGLTGGKGVKVMGFQLKDADEAKKYAKDVIVNSIGGKNKVIVEQKLVGEEFTLMAFCDGKNLEPVPVCQDHKRAHDGDFGENTGGMGSYSSSKMILPFLQEKDYSDALEAMRAILNAMEDEKNEFCGIMYGQFIATQEGVKLIEINARFGDPEGINVLAVLKNNLYEVLDVVAKKKLGSLRLEWEEKATVVKYIVPEGYPAKAVAPAEIAIDEEMLKRANAQIFYASVNEIDGKIYSSKSRSIAVLGKADTIEYAQKIAEDGCAAISGKVWHRKDIGTAALLQKRIERMKEIRRK